MPLIAFFFEDITVKRFKRTAIRNWLKGIVIKEGAHRIKSLNLIFCSDQYLLEINQSYLSHDTYTDIITFSHADDPAVIEGDIFISIDRVRENSDIYKKDFTEELNRVIIHGLLHLLGYKDKSKNDELLMRFKEDECLKSSNVPRGTYQ